MNFERESFYFFDWLETNSVGSSGVSLWFALLHTWCKAGCPVEFAVARSVLETKAGLGKDAIYDARNKLRQLGRIEWREQKGGRASVYKFITFAQQQPHLVGNSDTNSHEKPTGSATGSATGMATINSSSSNNNIDIITTTINTNVTEIPTPTATRTPLVGNSDTNSHENSHGDGAINPFKHYEKLFGLLRPLAIEEIKDFLTNGLDEDLVCLAMDRSYEKGVKHWGYAKSILDRCVMGKVYTLDAFFKQEEQYRNEKINKKSFKNGVIQVASNTKHVQSSGEEQDNPYGNIRPIKL